jgi:hypothetical protein
LADYRSKVVALCLNFAQQQDICVTPLSDLPWLKQQRSIDVDRRHVLFITIGPEPDNQ